MPSHLSFRNCFSTCVLWKDIYIYNTKSRSRMVWVFLKSGREFYDYHTISYLSTTFNVIQLSCCYILVCWSILRYFSNLFQLLIPPQCQFPLFVLRKYYFLFFSPICCLCVWCVHVCVCVCTA